MCDSKSDARVRAMSAPARSAPDTKVMNSSVEMREMRDDHSSLRRSDKRREPERAGTSLSDQRSKCHGWSEGMYDDVTVLAQAMLDRHAEAREAARCAALLRQSNERPKRLKIIGTRCIELGRSIKTFARLGAPGWKPVRKRS